MKGKALLQSIVRAVRFVYNKVTFFMEAMNHENS